MKTTLIWGPWDDSWLNKAAPVDDRWFEYAEVPLGDPIPTRYEWVARDMSDAKWAFDLGVHTFGASIVVRRGKGFRDDPA